MKSSDKIEKIRREYYLAKARLEVLCTGLGEQLKTAETWGDCEQIEDLIQLINESLPPAIADEQKKYEAYVPHRLRRRSVIRHKKTTAKKEVKAA